MGNTSMFNDKKNLTTPDSMIDEHKHRTNGGQKSGILKVECLIDIQGKVREWRTYVTA